MCRRCSRPGTLPGCLFDQAAGALTKLHTVSRKKKKQHTKAIRSHDSHEDGDLFLFLFFF